MLPYPRSRLIFIMGVATLLTAVVLIQLVRLQVVEHDRWKKEADDQHWGKIVIVPERGRIWDRNGVLLAGNDPRYEVWVDRRYVDILKLATVVAPRLNLKLADLNRALTDENDRAVLAYGLPVDVGERIYTEVISHTVPGVEVVQYWQRTYPEHALAAHVLGFFSAERKGYYGLEGYYNKILAGEEHSFQKDQDVRREPLPLDVPPDVSAWPGADLVLTIDSTVQMIVEDELAQAVDKTGAESGTLIVMDPRTGEILAMASAPSFDPNTFADTAKNEPARFVNRAVSENYEPGSVFKIVTLAAALDTGLVTPESTYNDTACIEVGGRSLCNWDRQAHGVVSMVTMIAKSLNVGAATLSTRMGAPTFYSYVRAFGFDNFTGIDLSGEASGHVRSQNDVKWYESDLGTNAFGQGLSATALQMIAAVAAVANDGVLVKPHVVKTIADGDQVRQAQPVEVRHPIKPETAHVLTQVLSEAVEREVPQAKVPGYRIAGKTGTAQIPIAGGYDDPWTIASFVGYGPVSDPRLIILVRLDRPKISPWGSDTAAPVFQRVASRLFTVLGIAPDDAAVASTR
jgi:cell division protein FtsI/penicillin-binding protein 2